MSESSVKRWVDDGRIAASRTAGGHRRIELGEALRFVREEEAPVVRPELLGLATVAPTSRRQEPAESAAMLEELLAGGRGAEAESAILALFLAGHPVATIVDDAIAPALARIGGPPTHTPESIFVEHRATEICRRALDRLRGLLPLPGSHAAVAVGGTVPGDFHQLASVAAATVLAAAGWNTVNLGFDTPVRSLAVAARRLRPRLVWLSVSWLVGEPAALAAELEALAETLAGRGCQAIVGGHALGALPLGDDGPLVRGGSMSDLAAFVTAPRAVARG